MAFCAKCGKKLPRGAKFCVKCGANVKVEEPKEVPKEEPKEETQVASVASKEVKQEEAPPVAPQNISNTPSNAAPQEKPVAVPAVAPVTAPTTPAPKSKSGYMFAAGVIIFVVIGFFMLASIGAKGQPGTIIKPTDVKIPQNLSAAEGGDKAIDLSWKKSNSPDVKKYNIYKSTKNAKDYQKISTIENGDLKYADSTVTKGNTYYYIVTAVTGSDKESGNSNQVSFALESEPLVPEGITIWDNVLAKYNTDSKYADVLTKVTKLTKSDIEKYVSIEKMGKKLKTTLKKGSHITNTTEKYKIIPDYVLTKDKEFLTDDKGLPHIMVWCGNPIKLIKKQTAFAQTVQSVQNITTNIVYVMPAQVTNVFINAAQPISGFVVGLLPNAFGPTMMNPEATDVADEWPADQIFVDTVEDLGIPTDKPLEEGQQWAAEGKILLEANPHDPNPGQSVYMTVQIFPAQSGVDIEYSVSGTDSYSANDTLSTDAEGKITFYIPGSSTGVSDTINVKVPSTGVEGSTTYTF